MQIWKGKSKLMWYGIHIDVSWPLAPVILEAIQSLVQVSNKKMCMFPTLIFRSEIVLPLKRSMCHLSSPSCKKHVYFPWIRVKNRVDCWLMWYSIFVRWLEISLTLLLMLMSCTIIFISKLWREVILPVYVMFGLQIYIASPCL